MISYAKVHDVVKNVAGHGYVPLAAHLTKGKKIHLDTFEIRRWRTICKKATRYLSTRRD